MSQSSFLIDVLQQSQVAKTLGGAGEWPLRAGYYRVTYEIHDGELIVLVLRKGHPVTAVFPSWTMYFARRIQRML